MAKLTLPVPLALFAVMLALVSTAAGAPDEQDGGRVELELAGVLPMPESAAGIVVLREKGRDVLLPVLVPDGRAVAHGGAAGGLVADAIEALGARVAEVEIDSAEETSAGARVRMTQGGRELEIRAVPSESIALAVAASAPIVTTRRLLDESGLTAADLARAHRRGATSGSGASTRL